MNESLKRGDGLNKKLEKILENQEKIIEYQEKLLNKENSLLLKEEKVEKEEEIALKDIEESEKIIKELKDLDKKILKDFKSKIRKVTKRDVFKGFVGAFIGVVGHFAFVKALYLGEHLSVLQSTFLYVFSFLIILIMLYYTGFRAMEKRLLFNLLPLRAVVLYSISLVTVIIVYVMFGKLEFPISLINLYNLIAPSMILATLGASTADLIGKGE